MQTPAVISEMSQLTREFDWGSTSLGPKNQWPQGLKTAVEIMLSSRYAMWIGWGPDFIFLYNDAYASMMLAAKRPWALGRPAREVWPEIWADVSSRAESVLRTGQATWDEKLLSFLNRGVSAEETYHTFSYSALPLDDDNIGGMLCVVTEDTERVIGERRLNTLRELATGITSNLDSVEKACENAALSLSNNLQDLPFSLIYLISDDENTFRLMGQSGLHGTTTINPSEISVSDNNGIWPLNDVLAKNCKIEVNQLKELFGEDKVGVWPEAPDKAIALPLTKPGQSRIAGVVIVGVSPRLSYDDNYKGFLELLVGHIGTALTNLQAYEHEKKRAQALSELESSRTIVDTSFVMASPGNTTPFIDEAFHWFPDTGQFEPQFENIEAHEVAAEYDKQLAPLVIIVDDNADMRQYLSSLLSPYYRVATATDGNDALKKINVSKPSLVLTDVMMPNLDGFGLIEGLRSSPRTRQIPVIMLSAGAGEESKIEGMKVGADDYLTKPFSARELFARVGSHLKMAQLRKQAAFEINDRESKLHMAIAAARMVVWEWNPQTDELVVSENADEIFGLRPNSTPQGNADAFSLVHPEDVQYTKSIIDKAVRHGGEFHMQFRMVRPDTGVTLWFEQWGHATKDIDGTTRLVGVSMDITERKLMDEALLESEAHFRNMANNAPTMLWVTDSEGACTFLSRGWYEYTGQSESEGLGVGWLDAIHPDDFEKAGETFRNANRSRSAFSLDYRLRLKGGNYHWAIDSGRPRFDSFGKFLGFVGAVTDVHERKIAEEAQRRSAETFAALIEQSPLGIYVVDSNFQIAIVSLGSKPAFKNVQPVVGRDFGEVMQTIWEKEYADEIIAIFRHTLDTGEEYIASGLTEERKDLGAQESYEWQINRVVLADGKFGVVCYYYDSTRLQQALQALRKSEERFRMLADNMSQLAWTCDTLGDVNWFNQRWFDYVGRSHEDMAGWGWKAVVHPDHEKQVVASMESSRRSGEIWEDTFALLGADGEYRWFLSRALPIHNHQGFIVRWFGTNTDVSELRETQQLLHETDQRKNEFLATLAHELRNPLAPIRTGLELLKVTKGDILSFEKTLSTMERQTIQLITLVDDLMDISRITRGKLELRKTTVELADIIESAIEASRPFIEASGHTLNIALPDEPVHLKADPHRLAQVLSNILNNAAKYTPEGGFIAFSVTHHGSQLAISVKDNGIGIPSEMHAQIFEMFSQIDHPIEKTYTGLGIGLTLVKQLVEMHDGSVVVRSEGKGKGSEFVILLPVSADSIQQDSELIEDEVTCDRSALKILVVDDNKDAAETLAQLITLLDNDVRIAHDGIEAIKLAEEYRPDLILMDIGMPNINGYEATRRIRSQRWGKGINIVALTGWGQTEDKQKSAEAGFDHHLVKPLDLRKLNEILAMKRPN